MKNMLFNKKNKQVKCQECKHYLDKNDCQIIKSFVIFDKNDIGRAELAWHRREEKNNHFKEWYEIYYCPMHKKDYDVEEILFDLLDYEVVRTYRHIKVDKLEKVKT